MIPFIQRVTQAVEPREARLRLRELVGVSSSRSSSTGSAAT